MVSTISFSTQEQDHILQSNKILQVLCCPLLQSYIKHRLANFFSNGKTVNILGCWNYSTLSFQCKSGHKYYVNKILKDMLCYNKTLNREAHSCWSLFYSDQCFKTVLRYIIWGKSLSVNLNKGLVIHRSMPSQQDFYLCFHMKMIRNVMAKEEILRTRHKKRNFEAPLFL